MVLLLAQIFCGMVKPVCCAGYYLVRDGAKSSLLLLAEVGLVSCMHMAEGNLKLCC